MLNKHGHSPKRRTCRNYTSKEQSAALKDAARLGLATAARSHGIPESTLRGWAKAKEREPRTEPKIEVSKSHRISASHGSGGSGRAW